MIPSLVSNSCCSRYCLIHSSTVISYPKCCNSITDETLSHPVGYFGLWLRYGTLISCFSISRTLSLARIFSHKGQYYKQHGNTDCQRNPPDSDKPCNHIADHTYYSHNRCILHLCGRMIDMIALGSCRRHNRSIGNRRYMISTN